MHASQTTNVRSMSVGQARYVVWLMTFAYTVPMPVFATFVVLGLLKHAWLFAVLMGLFGAVFGVRAWRRLSGKSSMFDPAPILRARQRLRETRRER